MIGNWSNVKGCICMYLCMQKKKKIPTCRWSRWRLDEPLLINPVSGPRQKLWMNSWEPKEVPPPPLKHDGNLFRLIKRPPDLSLLSSHSHTHTQKDWKPNGILWESFWKFNHKVFPRRRPTSSDPKIDVFFSLFFSSFFFFFSSLSLIENPFSRIL